MTELTQQEQKVLGVCEELLDKHQERLEQDHEHLLDEEYVNGTHMTQEEARQQHEMFMEEFSSKHSAEYYMGGVLETYYANARSSNSNRDSLLAAATYGLFHGVSHFQITRRDVAELYGVSEGTISEHWADMLEETLYDESAREKMEAIIEGSRRGNSAPLSRHAE